MKNIFKLFVVLLIAGSSLTAHAQTAKIGHVNFQELLGIMPGQEAINQELETFVAGLETQLQAMQSELEAKYADYQNNQATMSEIIRQTKEKEIMDLQQRMEAFNQQAQYEIQNKQVELSEPLIKKAQDAITAVASENGFTYIINANDQVLLYKNGTDILPMVKAKLGL
ncbi:OmpH family outer membrane protein [Lentimicrobium sp. L6]|uniref:OmpH family outer membrane protein n=1 Tax=Lentimicrobium sp. L6 TaxID=2735916 RepID=UPI001556D26D|nr:OmpH family outer membrane protein [Lentimicrobium sp. L6]NPD83356.1 OmpH family outer membrane protein [Lentimicrobium sp. L6]